MTVTFYNGVIADSATTIADLIRVAVPNLISEKRRVYGPLSFRTQVDATGTPVLPERGDLALIAIDTDGPPWLVEWAESVPVSSPPPPGGGNMATLVSTAPTDGTNARTQLQTEVDTLIGVGGGTLELVHGKTYDLTAGGAVQLPAAIAGILKIKGNGAKLRLSAACPSPFLFQWTADYNVFRGFHLEDLVIDRNNISPTGYSYPILAASGFDRANWEDITVEKVKVINCPAPPTGVQPQADNDSRHIYIFSQHAAANEATQTYTRRIKIKDVYTEGGTYGVGILAQNTGGALDTNHFHDDIELENVYHDTLADFTNIPLIWSANFHIGSRGHGRKLRMKNCQGRRSGDVGVEINGMLDVLLDHCDMQDAAQVNYLFRNYNLGRQTTHAARQRFTAEKCQSRYDVLVPSASQGNNPMEGFYLGTNLEATVDLDHCTHHVRRLDRMGQCRAIVGSARRINLSNFRAVYDQVNANPPSNQTPSWPLDLRGATTGKSIIKARGISIKVAGAGSGTFTFAPRLIYLSGADIWVDIHGVDIDAVITTPVGSATAYGIMSEATIINGHIEDVNVAAMNVASSNQAVIVNTTNVTRLDFENVDFSGLVAGASGSEWFINATARPLVNFKNVRRLTHPRAVTTVTVGASPYLYQNTSGMEQNVIIEGGTVSLIEWSINGTTFIPIGLTAGVFPISNGEYLRVTYSVVPNMRATYPR